MMQTQVKEHPIIFSRAMVQAILAGRKTQTRRIITPQPSLRTEGYWLTVCSTEEGREGYWTPREKAKPCGTAKETGDAVKCRYGRPGDRLWVREKWRLTGAHCQEKLWHYGEKAESVLGESLAYGADDEEGEGIEGTYRPSIHMPRWASRINLEVTGVRVERLNDISEEDAIAEGIHKFHGLEMYGYDPNGTPAEMIGGSAIAAFYYLWETINGTGSWLLNPFVWVIDFRRIEK